MSSYDIRFEGPAELALRVATTIADAEGVDLTSSQPPSVLDLGVVELLVTVEGSHDDVAAAVAAIDGSLPDGATIQITG